MLALDIPQETTDFWQLGHMFGAKCYTDLTPQAIHYGSTSDLCSVMEPKKIQNSKQARWCRDQVLTNIINEHPSQLLLYLFLLLSSSNEDQLFCSYCFEETCQLF